MDSDSLRIRRIDLSNDKGQCIAYFLPAEFSIPVTELDAATYPDHWRKFWDLAKRRIEEEYGEDL